MKAKKIFLWLAISSPILYISSCVIISAYKDKAFDAIKIGDTQESVIESIGNPSMRETSGFLFPRYASKKCKDPCVERLWYENELAIGLEAWSFELDKEGRVINKAHWVLP
jgi:hypothetical protein